MEIKRIIQKLMKEVVPWKDSKVEKCLAKLRKKQWKPKLIKLEITEVLEQIPALIKSRGSLGNILKLYNIAKKNHKK